jgi:hypothetical protein
MAFYVTGRKVEVPEGSPSRYICPASFLKDAGYPRKVVNTI